MGGKSGTPPVKLLWVRGRRDVSATGWAKSSRYGVGAGVEAVGTATFATNAGEVIAGLRVARGIEWIQGVALGEAVVMRACTQGLARGSRGRIGSGVVATSARGRASRSNSICRARDGGAARAR